MTEFQNKLNREAKIKQTEKKKIDKSTVMLKNFNILLSVL